MPARRQRVAAASAPVLAQTADSAFAKHLAPLGEHRSHHAPRTAPRPTARRRAAGTPARTTAECTFGRGRNAPGGRVRTGRTSAWSCDQDRQHAVVAASRASARCRSATSRCSISVASTRRPPVALCARAAGTGSATRRCRAGCPRPGVGRSARPPRGRSRGSRRATSVTFGGSAARSAATMSRSISTAVRRADPRRQPQRQRAGPGPISRNRSSGCGSIAADELVGPRRLEEVLAESLLRATLACQGSDVVQRFAAPVLLLDLLDLFLAHAEVVAELVDHGLGTQSRISSSSSHASSMGRW